jgi:hypothetical protein
MPDLFGDPGGDFGSETQDHHGGFASLHDAEMAAGQLLDGRQVGGEGDGLGCRGNLPDAGHGEVPDLPPVGAPGQQMPAAHIVHQMQGPDGPAGSIVGMGGVVGDGEHPVIEEGLGRPAEGCGVDLRVFDILDRDLLGHPVQAGFTLFAGSSGHPVDQPAEIVFQGRVGDGRGQADGEGQGQDIGLADPVAGDLEGIVGVAVALFAEVIDQRGQEAVAHEFDIALGGARGDSKLPGQVRGVGIAVGPDPAMKPEEPLILQPFGHSLPSVIPGFSAGVGQRIIGWSAYNQRILSQGASPDNLLGCVFKSVISNVESDAVYFPPWRTASNMAAVAFSILSRTGSISSLA